MKTRLPVLLGMALCLLGVSRPARAQYGLQYAPRAVMMPSVNPGMQGAYGQPIYAGQPVLAAQLAEFIGPRPPMGYAVRPPATLVAAPAGNAVPAPRSNVRVAVASEEDVAPADGQKGADASDAGSKAGGTKGEADHKACGCVDKCCCKSFSFRLFGDYLYLRARDAEVCYAVEANSPLGAASPIPIQKSPIGILDQNAGSGFRAGFGVGLTECSELAVTYTHFETAASDDITLVGPLQQITAMALHPATLDTVTGTVAANARHDIDMDLADLDYRHMLWCGDRGNLTGVVGMRWGSLEQSFWANYTDLIGGVPDARVATDIDFTGLGLRLGLEGETYAPHRRMLFYAKGYANFLAGEFDATYQQSVQNHSNLGVNTEWKAGRIVPSFDFEIGTGYYSPCGRLRLTVGYLLSVWTNTVKTEDFIHAVQTNDFRDMGDTMTFDGLVARVEGRF